MQKEISNLIFALEKRINGIYNEIQSNPSSLGKDRELVKILELLSDTIEKMEVKFVRTRTQP